MKSSRFFDKQAHFLFVFSYNPNREMFYTALHFPFGQKSLIEFILYQSCWQVLLYSAVLTAAIFSSFDR